MANKSVSALPLSRNDVSCLAQPFQLAFNYFCTHNSPLYEDYVKRLGVVVGLGFTAVLVDGTFLQNYQLQLQIFLDHVDFKSHPQRTVALSLAMAEMVNLGAYLFRVLGYPGYYDYFAAAVEKVVGSSLSGIYGNLEENRWLRVQQLLETILPKR